jgi:ProP effector
MATCMVNTAITTDSLIFHPTDNLTDSVHILMTEPVANTPAVAADAHPGSAKPRRSGPAQRRPEAGRPAPSSVPRSNPVLDQLAALYPHLFGEVFLPLKRGIFQDLLAAHPEAFEREALKAALAFHTRSSRYLTAVAAGQQRHDLQGQAVEAMAPEHVHHALLEVFRRRQGRANEDLGPKLRERIIHAFEASGLSRADYAALVHSRDEAANAVLDEALTEAAARAAKDEALLRAFEASKQTVETFADMYGMDPRAATLTLERGRRRRT